MVELNHRVLDLVTGEFGVLEVIDSASCFELPEQTLDRIAQVIKEKNIQINDGNERRKWWRF